MALALAQIWHETEAPVTQSIQTYFVEFKLFDKMKEIIAEFGSMKR